MGATPHILVVEDSVLIAMEPESLVEQAGNSVEGPVATVEAGLEAIRKRIYSSACATS